MTNPPALVFFGNERIATSVTTATPVLQALIAAGYPIAAVITKRQAGAASRHHSQPLEIENLAAAHGLPVLHPDRLSDISDQLRSYQAAAGILVAYGKLIPQSIIDLFPSGIINLHPSLLPTHRGPVPLEQVILDGATVTGISLMALTKQMDAGPLYAQTRLALTGAESKQALADHLLDLGKNLLIQNLPGILAGQITATPQDHTLATYDRLLTKADGRLDWTRPAQELERQIRAYLGWPGSTATLLGADVTITDAAVASPDQTPPGQPNPILPPGTPYKTSDRQLAVSCGQGSLIIRRLKPAGKRDMTSREFLAGHPL